MVYVEVKIIKGRAYCYERFSYRVGGVVKHTSKYLGPLKPKNKVKKR